MNKTYLTISAALMVMFFGSSSASAYDHEFCSNYAQRAVGQYYEAQQRGLSNLSWPRWGNHRQGHYDWCMAFPGHAESEMYARQQEIDSAVQGGSFNTGSYGGGWRK